MKKIFLSLAIALVALMGQAFTRGEAQDAIIKFGTDSMFRHGAFSVALMEIENDSLLGGWNAELSCITASTMKTVTSSTALQLLGPDFTFKTRVYLVGEQKGKKFKGNVLIVGSGDPTLGSVFFPKNPNIVTEVVEALKARGIEKIEGQITVDDSLIPFPSAHSWWEVGDLAWSYGMGIHALNFYDNRTQLKFTAQDGMLQNMRLEPAVPGVQLVDHLTSRDTIDDIDLRLEEVNPSIAVLGSAKNSDYDFTVANPTPAAMLIDSLSRDITAAGIKIKVKPEALSKVKEPKQEMLVEHLSPSLKDIIISLLDRSDNMFTEGLLRAVAVYTGHKGTASAGVAVVDSLWTSVGIDTRALFQRDGSGLARGNVNSAHFFVDMLSYMAKHPKDGVYLSELMPPVRYRIGKLIPETSLFENMRVKSGSMTQVQCFVGYYPAENPKYCWAILANDWNCTRQELRNKMDEMLIGIFGNDADKAQLKK